jgi:hypothetical protein
MFNPPLTHLLYACMHAYIHTSTCLRSNCCLSVASLLPILYTSIIYTAYDKHGTVSTILLPAQ